MLKNGVEPQDSFSLQHDANITSSNSGGIFQLIRFDDDFCKTVMLNLMTAVSRFQEPAYPQTVRQ
ncbi:MAG: hypothetical protein QOJ41_3098 [Acidobacteriaceae bacterium]|jgi:hypothetical protein|nr:hypothetical protein [Acidobacteriaceae bacterium]